MTKIDINIRMSYMTRRNIKNNMYGAIYYHTYTLCAAWDMILGPRVHKKNRIIDLQSAWFGLNFIVDQASSEMANHI